MTVYPEEYMDLLVEYCMLKINAVIKVLETNQSWSGEDDFSMEKPKLSIQVIFYYDRRFIIHLLPSRTFSHNGQLRFIVGSW